MNNVSSYDFIENIRAWNVNKIKQLICEVQKAQIPFSDHVYPDLDSIIEALYDHFTFSSPGKKDFAAAYYQNLPDTAYEILEILRPFYDIDESKQPAHKHFLYQPVMRGDLRMLEYLWQLPTLQYRKHRHPLRELLQLGILDFCYMRLPDWQNLPEYKDESGKIINNVYKLDLNSPDLIRNLYVQAERCNVPAPAHLKFLHQQIAPAQDLESDFIQLPPLNDPQRDFKSEFILHMDDPQLELQIEHDTSYGTAIRNWQIHDRHINHQYQCVEELTRSCLASGEYWSMTCECGYPACANVNCPVLAMRFNDTVRWRITDSDDAENPSVYYLEFSVKTYLRDMDLLLKTVEDGIKSDGAIEGDSLEHGQIAIIPSTGCGLQKVRKIRSMIRKAQRSNI